MDLCLVIIIPSCFWLLYRKSSILTDSNFEPQIVTAHVDYNLTAGRDDSIKLQRILKDFSWEQISNLSFSICPQCIICLQRNFVVQFSDIEKWMHNTHHSSFLFSPQKSLRGSSLLPQISSKKTAGATMCAAVVVHLLWSQFPDLFIALSFLFVGSICEVTVKLWPHHPLLSRLSWCHPY